jgi:hypothetical protein
VNVSTQCLRTYPGRGTPFLNQQLTEIQFDSSTTTGRSYGAADRTLVLHKAVHGGEVHHCEVKLSYKVNGTPQWDPINGTQVFLPQF